jgi:hypothetical protein
MNECGRHIHRAVLRKRSTAWSHSYTECKINKNKKVALRNRE